MAHGGGPTSGYPKRKLKSGHGQASSFDPGRFPGFSYLLGTPPAKKRSAWGKDLNAAETMLQSLYYTLPAGPPPENTNLPAGYTYLLQLVAHDLVNSTEPLWVAVDADIPVRNERGTTLRLDTLYGGGPTICPLAFAPGDSAPPDYATDLRLGRIKDDEDLNLTGQCPMRDIARLTLTSSVASAANFDDRSTQLYLADARNGEGAILSQLVVLFFILHNAAVGRLSETLLPSARFQYARAAVLEMYRSVIRNDLLKRLLHPTIYALLSARGASSGDWLWRGRAIPYEFSHGAFRIGHAMPRMSYQPNTRAESLGIGQLLQSAEGPLLASWVVEWSRFFELSDQSPNYALSFEPAQQTGLNDGNMLDVVPKKELDISLRDWLSAVAARMWRTDALIEALKARYPGVTFIEPPQIETWLNNLLDDPVKSTQRTALPRDVVQKLAADLPLPLYVLLESKFDQEGSRAGALGSIIIGEVLFKLLAAEEEAARHDPLTRAAQKAFGSNWADIEAVNCMPALVRLAAKWGNLEQCPGLPFISPPSNE